VKRNSTRSRKLLSRTSTPTWLGAGMVIRGWALAELTRAQEKLEQCTKGLSVYRATGAIFHTGRFLIFLGEIYAKLDSNVEGLNCVSEAQRIDEREHEAELNRLYGDLPLATGDEPAADRAYHQVLTIAKRQIAKLWELCAACPCRVGYSNPNVPMVKHTQDWQGEHASFPVW
jgi:hypothetical protein